MIGLKNELSWEMGFDGELDISDADEERSSCEEMSSEKMSSELKGDESLIAYLISFGVSYLIESEKRMKLLR